MIDKAKLMRELAAAKEKGLVQSSPEPPPEPTHVEARASSDAIKDHTRRALRMDFALISAYLGITVSPEMAPLRVAKVVRTRLAEMKSDGSLNSIPSQILVLLEGLRTPGVDLAEVRVNRRSNEVIITGSIQLLTSPGIQVLLNSSKWRVSQDGCELRIIDSPLLAFGPAQLQRAISKLIDNDCRQPS